MMDRSGRQKPVIAGQRDPPVREDTNRPSVEHLFLFEIAVHGRVLVVDQLNIRGLVGCDDHVWQLLSVGITFLPVGDGRFLLSVDQHYGNGELRRRVGAALRDDDLAPEV